MSMGVRKGRLALGAIAALSAGGCASSGDGATSALDASVAVPGSAGGSRASTPAYALSADELEYSCKQLAGRMQVRILEIRDYNERRHASGLAQVMRAASDDVKGRADQADGSPSAYRRDLAMLEAYNAQLKAKDCSTYDLAEEIRPKDFRETPAVRKR